MISEADGSSTGPASVKIADPDGNTILAWPRGTPGLVLGTLFVIVLLGYRAMIPLMHVVIVAHYLASKGVAQMKPLVLAGTSGASTPALVMAIRSPSGLVLSLIGRRYADS